MLGYYKVHVVKFRFEVKLFLIFSNRDNWLKIEDRVMEILHIAFGGGPKPPIFLFFVSSDCFEAPLI